MGNGCVTRRCPCCGPLKTSQVLPEPAASQWTASAGCAGLVCPPRPRNPLNGCAAQLVSIATTTRTTPPSLSPRGPTGRQQKEGIIGGRSRRMARRAAAWRAAGPSALGPVGAAISDAAKWVGSLRCRALRASPRQRRVAASFDVAAVLGKLRALGSSVFSTPTGMRHGRWAPPLPPPARLWCRTRRGCFAVISFFRPYSAALAEPG